MKQKWTKRDDLAGKKQGWAIFAVDNGSIALQALDDPEAVAAENGLKYKGSKFASDEAALAYVKEQAKAGNKVCQKALDVLNARVYENHCKVCAHRVEYWYSLEGLEGRELTDELTERLDTDAEERAKECIIEDYIEGELNSHDVDADENDIFFKGWWQISRT